MRWLPVIVVQAYIDPSVRQEFERWFRKVHLPRVLATPGMLRVYRADCRRPGVNWSAAYVLINDAAISTVWEGRAAEACRRDWRPWLPYMENFRMEVYAGLPTNPIYRCEN